MKSVLLIVAALILVAGCSGPSMAPGEVPLERSTQTFDDELSRGLTLKERSELAETDRTLIYNAFFRLNSLFTDSVHRAVLDMAVRYNGFVLEAEPQRSSIRVPSVRLDVVVKEIESLGEVVDKKITGEDVTDRYLDLKIRLENAQKTRERYLALLDQARNIEEILRIERELDRINKDIDLLTGKLNQMEHVIKYATITVETTPKIKPGPVAWTFTQMYKGVKWLFVRD